MPPVFRRIGENETNMNRSCDRADQCLVRDSEPDGCLTVVLALKAYAAFNSNSLACESKLS